ncbi:MAG: phage major capsid protein [Alphaproteobacteria bacterium HGW-Alphaproteobacteria-5]|nr:MAG: phage major capsid protein [Alphaproteobacteria bacterium HGW-Alphaproteobacteria-5]
MPKLTLPARLHRAGAIEAVRMDGAEEDDRRVALSFSSEEPVDRYFGREVLGHNPGEVDLARLASGSAPLLLDHRATIDHQVGVVESVTISGGRGRAVVRFGKSARAADILARVRDGEVAGVSVGYRVNALRLESEDADGGRTYRATSWTPLEISLVSIPADASVGVGRSTDAGAETVEILIQKRDSDMPDTTPAAAPAPTPAPAPSARVEVGADLRAERGRVKEIRAMARSFDLPEDMADAAVDNGESVEAFQRKVLDHLGSREANDLRQGAARVGLSDREARSFSIMRALRYLANPTDKRAREDAAFEIEVSQAAEAATGRSAAGILVPADVLARADFTRSQTVGTPAAGGNLVATDHLAGSFIDLLRKRSALTRLGVTVLGGLRGNVEIPRQSGGSTAYWVGENAAPTESGLAFDKVALTPHTLAAAVPISRRALLQTSPDIEALTRNDLIRVMALEMDRVGLNGDADTDAPAGLLDNAGISIVDFEAAAPTWEKVVALESAISANDADVAGMLYAMNAAMRGTLKTTRKDAGSGLFVMSETGQEAGECRADRFLVVDHQGGDQG